MKRDLPRILPRMSIKQQSRVSRLASRSQTTITFLLSRPQHHRLSISLLCCLARTKLSETMRSPHCRRRGDANRKDVLSASPLSASPNSNSATYWKPQDILEAVIASTSTIQTPRSDWQEYPLAACDWDLLQELLQSHEQRGVRLRYTSRGRC